MTRFIGFGLALVLTTTFCNIHSISGAKIDAFNYKVCGKFDLTKVFGGYYVKLGAHPSYLKHLGFKKTGEREREYHCGATLIHKDMAITAAHCVADIYKQVVIASIAEYKGLVDTENPNARVVNRTCAHPKYPKSELDSPVWDVAVLKLNKPFQYSRYIQPACLDLKYKIKLGDKLTLVGFGATNKSLDQSSQLKAIDMSRSCREGLVKNELLTSTCLYWRDDKHRGDTCAGDSGGPSYMRGRKGAFVLGLVSYGIDIPGESCSGKDDDATYITELSKIPDLKSLIDQCSE